MIGKWVHDQMDIQTDQRDKDTNHVVNDDTDRTQTVMET